MKLLGPSFLFNPCASSAAAAAPFDELTLSDRQLEAKVAKLRTKGYFTIPVARTTRQFLHAQSAAMPPATGARHSRDFKGSDFEETATLLATRVVSRLALDDLPLIPQEFQVRKPSAASASGWHQDKAPKFLTCITTLEGAGTQFVSPEVFKEKFVQISDYPVTLAPSGGNKSIEKDIRTTKPGKFYFFANLGINDARVPKLVHRAPGESGRSIFLARWMENKRAVRPTPKPKSTAPDSA